MKSKGKGEIAIKTKRVEIIFLIVYFLSALLCFLLFKSANCIIGSFLGFSVSLGDWYLLKIMSRKWLKTGKYSVSDYVIRLVVMGVSVYALLSIGTNIFGIFVGVSIIPISLMILITMNVFTKRKILL